MTQQHDLAPEAVTDGPAWLITGAGRGLGDAFARAALESGARVAGLVRTAGALGALGAEYPGRVVEVVADVRDRGAVQAAVDAAARELGRLDVIVNNAGYGLVGTIEEVSEDDARAILDTNLLGTIWTTQAAIPHLRASGGGDVVQISTTGAIGSMPALGLYNASKWGLEGYGEALAAEVAAFGIHVTLAQLGGFDTDWGGTSMQFAAPQERYDELRTRIFGTAEVPWPLAEDAGETTAAADDDAAAGDGAATGDAAPRRAAQALVAHLAGTPRPLRVLIGHDAPGQAALAYAARRDSYGDAPGFTWPGPSEQPGD